MENLESSDPAALNSSNETISEELNEEFHDPCGQLLEEEAGNPTESDRFEEANAEPHDSSSDAQPCESHNTASLSSAPDPNSNTAFTPLTPIDSSNEVPDDHAVPTDPASKPPLPIDPMCSKDYITTRKATDSALELDIFDVQYICLIVVIQYSDLFC